MIYILILIHILIISFLIIKYISGFTEQEYTGRQNNFSIIIAAKNEEVNISSLLISLESQNYPQHKYEVIIADDNSCDNTFEVVKNRIKNMSNFFLLKADDKKYPGKKGALELAISSAKNKFILITDADCKPEKEWISSFNKMFNNNYDFLFGAAPFFQKVGFINNLSCFENLRTFFLTTAFANCAIPYSASSRNFGFRKEAFQKLEGFKDTLQTIGGDDDLLLQKAVKNNMKIGVVTSTGSLVYSETKSSFKDYVFQKSRHTKTSFYYSNKTKFFLSLWHTYNLFFLFSPFLTAINPAYLLLFFTKIISDVIIVKSSQKFLRYNFSIFKIIYLQIFYELFIIINFFTAIILKPEWK